MILLFCTWSLFFIGKDVDNIDIMSERYKRALDAGANAAYACRAYDSGSALLHQGSGYGVGLEDSNNIPIDREDALKWFYRLFFRNLSITTDYSRQEELKKYIPMKAVILYDRLMIADSEDNWYSYCPAGEKKYILEYMGRDYLFTLSDQVYDIAAQKWIRDIDMGLAQEERRSLVTQFILKEINGFLRKRDNSNSNNNYNVVVALNDMEDNKLSGINGVNFIALCEGIPIPSLNPFRKADFFAYSLGGSEITR